MTDKTMEECGLLLSQKDSEIADLKSRECSGCIKKIFEIGQNELQLAAKEKRIAELERTILDIRGQRGDPKDKRTIAALESKLRMNSIYTCYKCKSEHSTDNMVSYCASCFSALESSG